MQHAAAVMCILYLDNQVIVSLANGEPVVYQWEAGCFWDPQNSKCLSLGSPGILITEMVAVAGKLWCGCHSQVIVLSTPPWHKSDLLTFDCFLFKICGEILKAQPETPPAASLAWLCLLSPPAHAPGGPGQRARRHLHGERGQRRLGGTAEQCPGPALPRHQLRAVGRS
ncbi:uncharacterized protein [Melanerpes formicivorus]|uniref:uncharacterized protein isoform X2 n=1 Tax=Melanerpes formicivorus TaxID=211600 RepID=UPI00358DDEE1